MVLAEHPDSFNYKCLNARGDCEQRLRRHMASTLVTNNVASNLECIRCVDGVRVTATEGASPRLLPLSAPVFAMSSTPHQLFLPLVTRLSGGHSLLKRGCSSSAAITAAAATTTVLVGEWLFPDTRSEPTTVTFPLHATVPFRSDRNRSDKFLGIPFRSVPFRSEEPHS